MQHSYNHLMNQFSEITQSLAGDEEAKNKLLDIEESLKSAIEDLETRSKEVSSLLTASRAVLQHQNFTVAARSIFDAACDLIGATSGYVALLTDDGTENEVLFLEAGNRPCTVDPELPMPIRGLREISYREKRAAYDNDFWNSDWMEFMPPGHVKLDNVMFAPLIVDNKAIGLMGIANKPGGFNDHDAKMATAFGELAAIALRNSRTLDSLNTSQNQLTVLNQQKDKLLSLIAHDLKDPFHALLGLSNGLNRNYDTLGDERIKHYLSRILETCEATYTFVNNLLTWARTQRSGTVVKKTHFSLIDALKSARDVVQSEFDEKGVRLNINVSPLQKVHADYEMTQTIFRNLFTNAMKYSSEGEVVEVKAEEHNSHLITKIKDSGIGMSEEQLENLFRIDKVCSTKGTNSEKGTGFGLIITKEFLDLNEGTIEVFSKPNKGTEIHVGLPIMRMEH